MPDYQESAREEFEQKYMTQNTLGEAEIQTDERGLFDLFRIYRDIQNRFHADQDVDKREAIREGTAFQVTGYLFGELIGALGGGYRAQTHYKGAMDAYAIESKLTRKYVNKLLEKEREEIEKAEASTPPGDEESETQKKTKTEQKPRSTQEIIRDMKKVTPPDTGNT